MGEDYWTSVDYYRNKLIEAEEFIKLSDTPISDLYKKVNELEDKVEKQAHYIEELARDKDEYRSEVVALEYELSYYQAECTQCQDYKEVIKLLEEEIELGKNYWFKLLDSMCPPGVTKFDKTPSQEWRENQERVEAMIKLESEKV